MKNRELAVILGVVLIILLAIIGYVFITNFSPSTVTNFESCAAAGYPVMESYPRQCRTASGKTFVETIPNTDDKTYVSTDPEQCKLIKFMCVQGKRPFFDNKGCGCKTDPDYNNETEPTEMKTYCAAYSRPAGFCIQVYEPVCGWFDPAKIQCIKYPCAETFSNSCVACNNENVLYFTDGECPK